MRLLLSVTLLFSTLSLATGERHLVPVEDIDYEISLENGYDHIRLPRSFSCSGAGTPVLPSVSFCYALPKNKEIASVIVTHSQWEKFPGSYMLYPQQEYHVIGKEYTFYEKDSLLYASADTLPNQIVTRVHSGNIRGYSVGQVSICPFRYIPETGELFRLTLLEIDIETNDVETVIIPVRQSRQADAITKQFMSSLVVNNGILDNGNYKPATLTTTDEHDDHITDLPSLIGAPVDLLIITTNELLEEYSKYAIMKKKQGYNTTVRTISWIRQHYQGVDDSERMRNFIKDGVTKWGVVFVLLGGDVPAVPTRWIWMAPLYDEWAPHIATDHYFSDLDGLWNADGDEKFGEVDDDLDLYPDAFVGRLPTKTPQDVQNYRAKVTAYLHPTFTSIHDRVFFFTSDFNVTDDAYQMAMRLRTHLPAWFTKRVINERFRDEISDSISAGFGIVAGLGHGDVNNIRNKNTPRQSMNNYYFDALNHTDKYALMVVITCFTNPFQADCLGEHWLSCPTGGGIGYIGPSSSSEAYLHEEYTRVLFDSLFTASCAQVLAKSKIPFVPQSLWDNWYRLYQFSINYLGDPCITLWDSIPHVYTGVTMSPETLEIGLDTITISINPPIQSRVLFYKAGELYTWDSTVTGSIMRELFTESAGYVTFMIQDIATPTRGPRYVPLVDSIYVTPSRPRLAYDHHIVVDTLHNADGEINPGEDIFLQVYLKNNGGAAATGVQAQLFCDDSLIDMITNTATYPDIQPFEQATSLQPFFFKIQPKMPDEHSYEYQLNISHSSGTSLDSFQIVGSAPAMRHFTQYTTASGDTISILPFVQNQGHCRADTVNAEIAALSDSVILLDSIVAFPPVLPQDIIGSGSDIFKLYLTHPGAEKKYIFRLYSNNRLVDSTRVILDVPPAPESLRAIAQATSISLEWKSVEAAAGYRIYRGTEPEGTLLFLKNDLLPTSYFDDYAVQPAQDYYYSVIAVDSSMNEGIFSDTIRSRMNPVVKQGWPRPVYDYLFSSCNFGEIDLFYPGMEIVVCGKEGYVYAWHSDGTPVLQTDVFYDIHPAEVWTSPAIGDVDANGRNEVVFGVRRNSDNLYLLNNQGSCLPGWPITVPGHIIGSPVLSDIDADDDLEIFIWTLQADLYAFHHDGSGVFSASGLIKDLPGIALGTPAIGDMNRDGNLEIVCCGGSASDSLYVWDNNGNYLPPFPTMIQPEGLTYSTVLGDVIGDDQLEIGFYADNLERVYLVDATGSILWFKDIQNVADIEGSPVFADVTGDGRPEIICGYQSGFTIFDSLGNELTGFPETHHDAKLPVVASVNENEGQSVIVGSANWNIHGYRPDGSTPAGFPIQLGCRIESSPAIFDVDYDNRLELFYGGNDFAFFMHDLETSDFEWPRFRYDPYNTGVYRSPHLPGITADKEIHQSLRLLVSQPTVFQKQIMIAWQKIRPHMPFTIKIYNILGQCIKILYRGEPSSGEIYSSTDFHPNGSVTWLGDDDQDRSVAAGIYFVCLEQGKMKITQKVIKVK